MKHAIRWFAALLAVAVLAAMLHACAEDDDDDDDCSSVVKDPLTDCEAVCNEDTCAIVKECEDYIEGGPPENCLDDCFKGCRKGCIPNGTTACLESFTDCETLIHCLEPLFSS